MKWPAFEKILLPEYQSTEIKNCLVLFTPCPNRFSNAPDFNQPFSRLNGRFFAESLFLKPPKRVKTTRKILKIIEHVSCSIRYCQISLLTYSGSSSLSKSGHFSDSQGKFRRVTCTYSQVSEATWETKNFFRPLELRNHRKCTAGASQS